VEGPDSVNSMAGINYSRLSSLLAEGQVRKPAAAQFE
jgi:hypothetical protein